MIVKNRLSADLMRPDIDIGGVAECYGINGRMPLEWVAECSWNRWPNGTGICTRYAREPGDLSGIHCS